MNRRQFFAFLPLMVVARKMVAAVKPKPRLPWPYSEYRFILHLRKPDGYAAGIDLRPAHCINGIADLQVIQKHFDHWGNA